MKAKDLEKNFDKVETKEGTFYKMKKLDRSNYTYCYPVQIVNEEYEKNEPIIKAKIEEYMIKYTIADYEGDDKIQGNYEISVERIYQAEKDIWCLVTVYVKPYDINSSYWKENFSNNEIHYNPEKTNDCIVDVHYFIRLSSSNNYEIEYIGLKPENYDEYVSDLKNEGIDLENLDVEKILNTKYTDEIEVIPSSETLAISGKKVEYNLENVKEISNMAWGIRIVLVFLMIGIFAWGRIKKRNR